MMNNKNGQKISDDRIAPCKGCPDRYLGCHDRCERFNKWKDRLHERKAREKEYNLQVREDFLRSERCENLTKNYFKSKCGR